MGAASKEAVSLERNTEIFLGLFSFLEVKMEVESCTKAQSFDLYCSETEMVAK